MTDTTSAPATETAAGATAASDTRANATAASDAPANATAERERERLPRGTRWFLAMCVLFLGGSGLVYEYCLSTVATHLVGNSVEQFSIIIALMLFAMGLAGLAQRAVKDPERLTQVFVIVEVALGFVGGASAIVLYVAFAYLEHFYLVLYVLALGIGFAIGMEIPLLMRLNQRFQPELRENVGQVLSLDYIGALVGALVWAFALLPLLPLDRISLILGLLNIGVALATVIVFWQRLERRLALAALAVAAALGLAALGAAAPSMMRGARQHLYADPVRYQVQSPYQHIVITGSGARLSLYLDGRLQLDSEDEYIYHEMLVHPAMMALGRPPRDVLVLGGGDGMAVREILRWHSVRHVTLVDLDPEVTKLARSYAPLVQLNGGSLLDHRVRVKLAAGLHPANAARRVYKAAENQRLNLQRYREHVATVRVRHLDADRFVHAMAGSYDVIIADFPDPRTPDLAKLFTLEMYRAIRKRLRPGGILSVQAGSPYTARRAFWCAHDTLDAAGLYVLPLHANVPTFGEWGFLLAGRDATPQPRGQPPVPTRYLRPGVIAAARVFPPHIGRPRNFCLSTRLDPQVMRLYDAGERLAGKRLFPGSAER